MKDDPLNTPDYFPSRQRPKHIQQLTHFLTSNNPLLMIVGKPGTGKTSLFQQLEHLGQLPAHTLKLDGNSTLKPTKLADLIHATWQLGTHDAQLSKQEQFDQILKAREQYHQPGLLLIDQADNLPIATLAAIMHTSIKQLHQPIKLRIILMGSQALVNCVNNLHNPEINIPRITLKAFSPEETHDYVEHVMDKLGISKANVCSDTLVQQIHEQSGGLPRAVFEIAHQQLSMQKKLLLENKQTAPVTERPLSAKTKTRFWQHLVERHWIKGACTAMLVFTFAGIHRYQQRINGLDQLALNTPTMATQPARRAYPRFAKVKTQLNNAIDRTFKHGYHAQAKIITHSQHHHS